MTSKVKHTVGRLMRDAEWCDAGQGWQRALSALVACDAERDRARERQSEARELLRALGALYHPYDPQTGQAQPVERVAARFSAVWLRLKGLAEAAELPARARERIMKAERLTVQWLATLALFFAAVTARVEALALSPQLEAAVLEQLIPVIDLERVAACSTAAETRHRVQASSTALLDALRRADHPLQRLAPEDSTRVEQVAGACADLSNGAVPASKDATANCRCIITGVIA